MNTESDDDGLDALDRKAKAELKMALEGVNDYFQLKRITRAVELAKQGTDRGKLLMRLKGVVGVATANMVVAPGAVWAMLERTIDPIEFDPSLSGEEQALLEHAIALRSLADDLRDGGVEGQDAGCDDSHVAMLRMAVELAKGAALSNPKAAIILLEHYLEHYMEQISESTEDARDWGVPAYEEADMIVDVLRGIEYAHLLTEGKFAHSMEKLIDAVNGLRKEVHELREDTQQRCL